ncbi:hypothetical protein [Silvanigrella aquatica]|uniref:Uncharacterized protein n=1 Tax=Silvanigrella aquatica TaxID=1915309 RepID=A0A1L4D3Z1_9BACT|nr:hypothetical protein [Silvanigrella aquatica]APJ04918.1 hypothetical protein AXG55_13850 [Silvanigrella aquatica]
MFTFATKKFGVWKEERASNVIRYEINSRQIIFALGMAAFMSWISFIIAIKVREEFYMIESAPHSYMKLNSLKILDTEFFFNERKSAITIFITLDKNNNIKIVFDSGKSFIIPFQAAEFLDYFEERRQNIMLTSMLMRIEDRSISRIKIWPDKNINFKNIRYIIKIFSQFGYDDFDIAVER